MSALKNQYLENLLLDELAEMYAGEQQIAQALSGLAKLVPQGELKQLLEAHAYESVGHVSKVAEIFGCFTKASEGVKGNAIARLLAEAKAMGVFETALSTNDDTILALVQKIAHFEIAAYNCLRDWAGILENKKAGTLLEEILREEWDYESRLAELTHLKHMEQSHHAGWHSPEENEEEALAYRRYGVCV